MPDAKLLETFLTPAGAPIVIEHIGEEFTSVCPKTGHPDFGTVTLRYQPSPSPGAPGARRKARTPGGCVELKSLKLYYQSFRNEGIFYEAVTGRIRDDLVRVLRPVWLQIVTDWRGRGGIRSTIRADYGRVPVEWKGR
jgi:7-cyano-7-deazaguanine reductase